MSDYFDLPKEAGAKFAGKEVTVRGIKVKTLRTVAKMDSMSDEDKAKTAFLGEMLDTCDAVLTESTFFKSGKPLLSKEEFGNMEPDEMLRLFNAVMSEKTKNEQKKAGAKVRSPDIEFMLDLGLSLGKTQAELDDMPDEEFYLWAAYAGRKPLPLLKMDFMQAAVRAQIMVALGSGKQVNINDFMPKWGEIDDRQYMKTEDINKRNIYSACAMFGIPVEEVMKKVAEKEAAKKKES